MRIYNLDFIISFQKGIADGHSYILDTDIDGKLQLPGYQINAQFSCGTSHSKVSGTYVSAGEAINCILLGYLELRPTKLLLNEFFCAYCTFTQLQISP